VVFGNAVLELYIHNHTDTESNDKLNLALTHSQKHNLLQVYLH